MGMIYLLAVVVLPGTLASSRASADAGDATSAESSEPLGLSKFRVIDHNIEHRDSALRLAVEKALATRAQAITLQEVCFGQVRRLRRLHPDWTIAWMPGVVNDRCSERASLVSPVERQKSGNVAIWTGGGWGRTSTFAFTRQLDRGQHRGMACVTYRAGARVRICSVHLLSANEPVSRRIIRTAQAREVHRMTTEWVRADELVVVGGDFNAPPNKRALDYLYQFRGRGHFREALGRPDRGRDCRCKSQTTFDGGRTKIDYIFFSANRMTDTAARQLRVFRSLSDHHILSGWAYVDVGAQ